MACGRLPSGAGRLSRSDPIKIALFDWTSVNLNAKIMGGILEKLGYSVEYPTGRLSLQPDHRPDQWRPRRWAWNSGTTTAGEAMKASDATGQTEKLGHARAQGQGRVVVSANT